METGGDLLEQKSEHQTERWKGAAEHHQAGEVARRSVLEAARGLQKQRRVGRKDRRGKPA